MNQMQPLSLNDIREKFLAFFESKGHLRLPSFSLVPKNDPSILLINAGMTPLKPYFTGAETPPSLRVTNCQKCIRTPDIERVGKTSRHGTFFEMLGNFSFGDYFKKEIIPWAWEFCTDVLEMPQDRLYVSVYEEDDEAYDIWHKDVGLDPSRIFRLGKADNFWEHGTGPCGPCSEIHFDRGPEHGCDNPNCAVGCDCDRYVEFWNLVFTQYNREEDGTYTPLVKKNIDTGAGLERFASILQGVDNLFEVDTIRAILDYVCQIAGVDYGKDAKTDTAIRVITDHIRSTVMMVGDGIIPSNEGRGYVLRRLLRRAARYGLMLGIEGSFLHDVARIVIRESAVAYPELEHQSKHLTRVIRTEEERFDETIRQGSSILDDYLDQVREKGEALLSGNAVFRLHDTYGFPLDLTREIAGEQNIQIDEDGFHREMNRQKEMARQALKDKAGSAWDKSGLPDEVGQLPATEFSGYSRLEDKGTVLAILGADKNKDLEVLTEASAGLAVQVIFDKTPFYAESGGQSGDIGQIKTDRAKLTVEDTIKTADGIVVHLARIEQGILAVKDQAELRVDETRRLATARNHTTTHLLHKALKQVLGDHVAQAGSAVSADRLRFDFNHYQPLTDEEKLAVEQIVNDKILANLPVSTRVMNLEEARQSGATALFDEKYGDAVRVVSVGDFSSELCGGTHLSKSSEACLFRLVSEGGVAAGVRRIEGLTGQAAWDLVRTETKLLHESARLLKSSEQDLPVRIEQVVDKTRVLEKQLAAEHGKKAAQAADNLASDAEEINGIRIVAAAIDLPDPGKLRDTADRLRDSIEPGLVILAARSGDKVNFVAMASKQAVESGIHAGNIVREAARIAGGGGGGRPDMAQAGGKNPDKTTEALQAARALAVSMLEQ